MLKRQPHYIREYASMIAMLKKRHGDDVAMQKAVGGDYEEQGRFQADMVMSRAPEGPFSLMDVGCGSGRAAYALRDERRLTYWGLDIMPDLLDYAREKTGRADWKFDRISEIKLPAEDGWADMMLFMSVFTHLKPDEIRAYLREAGRVVKPGGLMICSFLDKANAVQRKTFHPAPLQHFARFIGRDVMLRFLRQDDLEAWATEAGFAVEEVVTDFEKGSQHLLVARRKE